LDVNEPHINDIIMRHTTLIETQRDLKENAVSNQVEIEKEQLNYTATIKVKYLSKIIYIYYYYYIIIIDFINHM